MNGLHKAKKTSPALKTTTPLRMKILNISLTNFKTISSKGAFCNIFFPVFICTLFDNNRLPRQNFKTLKVKVSLFVESLLKTTKISHTLSLYDENSLFIGFYISENGASF